MKNQAERERSGDGGRARPYLSRRARDPACGDFLLTERDVEILRALNRCRFLQTGQINRAVFPGNATLQSARRRLRFLFHHGFVGRIQLYAPPDGGSAETAYHLDAAGAAELDARGEDVHPILRRRNLKLRVRPLNPLLIRFAVGRSSRGGAHRSG